MFPWLNKGCVYIAVLSGKSDILWDYRDMLYKFAEHNHFKIEVVLTKSKEALLQSISIFSRKPDIIIVADQLISLFFYHSSGLPDAPGGASVFFCPSDKGAGSQLPCYHLCREMSTKRQKVPKMITARPTAQTVLPGAGL